MEIVHALARQVEAVRSRAQLVAGHFNLHAPGLPGEAAGLMEHGVPEASAAAGRGHGEFHDFGDSRGMVQLLFKTQVQHAQNLPLPLSQKAMEMRILKLIFINRLKGLTGKSGAFHVADEIVHYLPIMWFSLSK